MITMLLYSHLKKELADIKECGFNVSCKMSEDDWDFLEYDDRLLLEKYLEEHPIIDMSCIDVASEGGIELAEKVRKNNSNMYIIILSDTKVSPMIYIKPTIMAGSLLLRPLTVDSINNVFKEAISEYLKQFKLENGEKCFVIDNRDGRQLVPYEQIVFFEARDKKVFLNTETNEFAFYDTLDNLENKLNDNFARCHRSFIVSKSCIKKILFSQNMIILDNGFNVPLSRSYKSIFKELKR